MRKLYFAAALILAALPAAAQNLLLHSGQFGNPPATCVSAGGAVLILHNDTSALNVDSSASNHTIVVVAATQDSTNKVFGPSSAAYAGASAYQLTDVSADFGFGTGDFTIEARVRQTTSQQSNFVGDGDAAEGKLDVEYVTSGCSGPCLRAQINGGTQHLFPIAPNSTFADLVVQRASGTLNVFFNGVSAGTASDSGDIGASRSLQFAQRATGSEQWIGNFDEITVWKKAIYTSGNFTPKTLPFCNGS